MTDWALLPPVSGATLSPVAQAPRTTEAPTGFDTAGQAFEASILQPLLAAMLPPAESTAWGGGTGSQAWRGLFAEAVAAEIARSGGVGLAAPVDAALGVNAATPSADDSQ